jgi:hypothetical protein
MGSIKESMDLIHHAAEGVPADSSFDTFPIELRRISHPVSEATFSLLINHLHLDSILSLHSLSPHHTLSTLDGVHGDWMGFS